jgi:hypothetical protein
MRDPRGSMKDPRGRRRLPYNQGNLEVTRKSGKGSGSYQIIREI